MEDPVARALIESLQVQIGALHDQLRFVQTQLWGGFGGLFMIMAAPWAKSMVNGRQANKKDQSQSDD